ncbi:pentapeptide repeat-containing protein [Halocatena halophila]|uniref:pentapeptide repeat-containing protein n=1 Tax=Halocatena halophila TaxID=2814576 RepID=UPI002ED040C9
MAEKNTDIPENRCGYVLEFGEMNFIGDRSAWIERTNPVCCWRSVWKSHDETERCIWHADVDEKPLTELITRRGNDAERLDGAILRNLPKKGEMLSLGGCTLLGARLSNSEFQNVDFSNTDLSGADFTDANLQYTDFTDAELEGTGFRRATITQANFTGATITRSGFIEADLHGANFTDSDLSGADFTDADLRWGDLTDSFLRTADFTDADLQDADLSDADARYAKFRHATLQDAVFTRTDCRDVTFTSTLLYDTVFSDTRINSKTIFFNPKTTFYDSIMSRPSCIYEENPHIAEQLPKNIHPLEAAKWVYRRLEILHEENALSEEAREFHISKEEVERALYWKRGKYGPWGVKTLMWHLTRHGESVKRVLTWWGGVILSSGLLFAGLGGVRDSTNTEYAITSLSQLWTIAGWQEVLMNIYFSITTFSTIMDGGLAPAGNGMRVIVAIESIIGALLVALLVFVLGRRTAR